MLTVTKEIDFPLPGGDGAASAPEGAQVQVISLSGEEVTVRFAGVTKAVPYHYTSLEADVSTNRATIKRLEAERLAREEKERVEREKAEKEAAEAAKVRRALVEKQFSSWDGSHRGLTRYIKENMKDPKSYEHIETRFRDLGSNVLVITRFRGNNSFGGKTITTITAECDIDGAVKRILSQE